MLNMHRDYHDTWEKMEEAFFSGQAEGFETTSRGSFHYFADVRSGLTYRRAPYSDGDGVGGRAKLPSTSDTTVVMAALAAGLARIVHDSTLPGSHH